MIRCKVTLAGVVNKTAATREGKDGKPFVSFGVKLPLGDRNGNVMDFEVSVSADTGKIPEGAVSIGKRVEVLGTMYFRKTGDAVFLNLYADSVVADTTGIDKIEGDYLLRFMTSHPKDCSKELIDVIADSKHISTHLHLPFQSGNNRVLKAMNRSYDREKYLDIIRYAKERIPDVSLTSDVIVGFPGETYEEFLDTVSLVKEVEFTSLFTFIYSPREGTPAAKMPDPYTHEEKTKWFAELLKVQEEIAAKRCASMVDNVYRALAEGKTDKDGILMGRTSGNIIVEFEGDEKLIGQFVNVKITKSRNWILNGVLK